MDKTAVGRDCVTSLQGVPKHFPALDDETLQSQLKVDPLKVNGIFPPGSLAQKVGRDCQLDTFRQNKTLRVVLEEGQLKFTECTNAIAIFVGDHALIQEAIDSGSSADRRSVSVDFDRGGNEA